MELMVDSCDRRSFSPSTFACDNGNSSLEIHTDTLLHLLNEDLSGKEIDKEERTGTPTLPPTHDFDLYQASRSDAATRSANECLMMITQLDSALHSHILGQFWDRFNIVIPLVHKEAFLASLEAPTLHSNLHPELGSDVSGDSLLSTRYGPFCSPELHLAVLAMGVRRADHTRPDIAHLLLPGWDSSLHRQLRDVANLLPSVGQWSVCQVQATVLLAQLERERGGDHSARLYLGVYYRHANCHVRGEVQSRADMAWRNSRLSAAKDRGHAKHTKHPRHAHFRR